VFKLSRTTRAAQTESPRYHQPMSPSPPPPHDRILIAGCGDVGSRLGRLLADRGHLVWGLRRDPATLPRAIHPVAADLSDPSSLAVLPPRLDLVIYTAAADGRDETAYRATYVAGPRNLLEALRRAGQTPRRWLFTSSTGVYGQDDGSWVDEDSPTEPATMTGRVMLEGERVFESAPWPAVVARLAGIYGPGRTRLLDRVAAGEARCSAGETHYTNRIHADDAAAALAHLAHLPDPAPRHLVVDDEPAERCRVLRDLAEMLGAPPPPDGDPVTRGGNKRCSNRRLRASGWAPRYPSYREGYAEMVRDG
jgi:nucleoside-diphosphate-sugar epimerase